MIQKAKRTNSTSKQEVQQSKGKQNITRQNATLKMVVAQYFS